MCHAYIILYRYCGHIAFNLKSACPHLSPPTTSPDSKGSTLRKPSQLDNRPASDEAIKACAENYRYHRKEIQDGCPGCYDSDGLAATFAMRKYMEDSISKAAEAAGSTTTTTTTTTTFSSSPTTTTANTIAPTTTNTTTKASDTSSHGSSNTATRGSNTTTPSPPSITTRTTNKAWLPRLPRPKLVDTTPLTIPQFRRQYEHPWLSRWSDRSFGFWRSDVKMVGWYKRERGIKTWQEAEDRFLAFWDTWGKKGYGRSCAKNEEEEAAAEDEREKEEEEGGGRGESSLGLGLGRKNVRRKKGKKTSYEDGLGSGSEGEKVLRQEKDRAEYEAWRLKKYDLLSFVSWVKEEVSDCHCAWGQASVVAKMCLWEWQEGRKEGKGRNDESELWVRTDRPRWVGRDYYERFRVEGGGEDRDGDGKTEGGKERRERREKKKNEEDGGAAGIDGMRV